MEEAAEGERGDLLLVAVFRGAYPVEGGDPIREERLLDSLVVIPSF